MIDNGYSLKDCMKINMLKDFYYIWQNVTSSIIGPEEATQLSKMRLP